MRQSTMLLTLGIVLSVGLPGCSLNTVIGLLTSEPAGKELKIDIPEVAPPHPPTHPPEKQFLAGVAKVDITPPPGFPTGGHGPAGNVSRGHWGRLWARAFFFEDVNGRTVVFVSCDLFALPGGLRDMVAEDLAHRRGPGIPADALVISATHTHQGPGNYMTSKLYNKFGSSYAGYSDRLFTFLATRVTDAIHAAERNARSHGPVTLTLHTGPVGDIVLNRSPDVFLLNPTAQPFMDELENGNGGNGACKPAPGEPETGWDLEGCPRVRALNRRVSVLEVTRGGKRAGLMVFFAVHPTALLHNAPIYSPDFTGLAMGMVEKDDAEGHAVVGFFNGAEGDVTARRPTRDVHRVGDLAQRFAASIRDVVKLPGIDLGTAPEIQVRSERIPVAATKDTKDEAGATCSAQGKTVRLTGKPGGGAAGLGGGEGDRTILYDLGWREAVRDRPQHGQGPKLPALDSAYVRSLKPTTVIFKLPDFPPSLPLSVVALGPLTIAAVPVESSTFVGARIRAALIQPHVSPDLVQLVGLANEYASYVASRDEYMRQDYMGASTLWGPDEGAFFACRLAALRDRDVPYPPGSPRITLTYHPGPAETELLSKEPFGPSFCGDGRAAPDEELEDILVEYGPQNTKSPARNLPWFSWDEEARIQDGEAGRGAVKEDFRSTSCRAVAIDQKTSAGWTQWVSTETPDDGAGSGFITTLLYGADKPDARNVLSRRYAAIWLGPLFEKQNSLKGPYRFRVRLPNGTTICENNTTPCPELPEPATCRPGKGKS